MHKTIAFLIVLTILTATNTIIAKTASSAEIENSWTTMSSMPMGVAGAEAAVVNGKIYVIVSTVNYEYDPATNTWATKQPMPTPRADGIAVAVFENKIYVVGGRIIGGSTTGINEVYDPATDLWETRTSMPTARQGLSANVANGKIYLIGGLIPNLPDIPNANTFHSTNITEVYDPTTNSWTTAASIPTRLFTYASAVIDDKIYIISGNSGDTTNLTQIYNPKTNGWSYGAQISRGVQAAAAGATTGITASKAIYVIGGFVGFASPVDDVQIYSPENNSWGKGLPLPTARYDLALAVVDDTIYAIGGSTALYENATTRNDRYIPLRDGTIPQQEPFPTVPVIAIVGIVAVVVGTGLFVYFKKRKRYVGTFFSTCNSEIGIGGITCLSESRAFHLPYAMPFS